MRGKEQIGFDFVAAEVSFNKNARMCCLALIVPAGCTIGGRLRERMETRGWEEWRCARKVYKKCHEEGRVHGAVLLLFRGSGCRRRGPRRRHASLSVM